MIVSTNLTNFNLPSATIDPLYEFLKNINSIVDNFPKELKHKSLIWRPMISI